MGFSFQVCFETNPATLGVIVALIVRHLYGCLQFGLFVFPLYLGAVLSVPGHAIDPHFRSLAPPRNLVFRSDSARLMTGSRKKFRWELQAGDRIHFVAPGCAHAIQLLLNGSTDNRQGKSWLIEHDGKQISYNTWKNATTGNFHIDSLFSDRTSLSSMLTGKLPHQISGEDLSRAFSRVQELSSEDSFFDLLGLDPIQLQKEITPRKLGWEKTIGIQILAAITNNPAVITIDPMVSQNPSIAIRKLLIELEKRCRDSIIIGFENLPFQTNKTFEIR